ncbi:MAG: hypothetical protein Kow0090_22050 [Myxococcota bacterium]
MKQTPSELKKRLAEFCRSAGGCIGAAVMNMDGVVVASYVRSESDELHLTAMLSGALGIGERAAKELKLGALENVIIVGDEGIAVLSVCGEDRAIMALFEDSARLGLTLHDVRELARELQT